MSPPTVDMGYDEWLTAFKKACEEHGTEYLASIETGADKELERLFEEGRSPEEAIELLHWQA